MITKEEYRNRTLWHRELYDRLLHSAMPKSPQEFSQLKRYYMEEITPRIAIENENLQEYPCAIKDLLLLDFPYMRFHCSQLCPLMSSQVTGDCMGQLGCHLMETIIHGKKKQYYETLQKIRDLHFVAHGSMTKKVKEAKEIYDLI